MSLSLYFNGVKIPSWIKVKNISMSILPSLEVSRGRTVLKERIITIDFSFSKSTLLSIDKTQELFEWLKGDNFNESKLILPNDLNSYYMAKVKGSVDINGASRKGSGKIEFICYNPNRIDFNVYKFILKENSTFFYQGTADIYPSFEIDILTQCDSIKIEFSNSIYSNYQEVIGNFNKGDKILINQQTNKVLLNGIFSPSILSINSKRHKITYGSNRYKVLGNKASIKVIYQNEYEA